MSKGPKDKGDWDDCPKGKDDWMNRMKGHGQGKTRAWGLRSDVGGQRSEQKDGCPDEMRFTVTIVNFMG